VKRAALSILAVATGLTACSSAATEPQSAMTTTITATPTSSPSGGGTGVGVAFSLLTHCGISSTEYAGRTWVAVTPLPEPRVGADVAGTVTQDGYTDGTMTLLEDDLLRFVVTDPLVEETGLTVDFVPATAPVPLCE
jgi:poly(3-hydroxybutyrate) depolymerase